MITLKKRAFDLSIIFLFILVLSPSVFCRGEIRVSNPEVSIQMYSNMRLKQITLSAPVNSIFTVKMKNGELKNSMKTLSISLEL